MRTTKISLFLLFSLFTLNIHAVKVVFRFDDPRLIADSVSMRVVQLFNRKNIPLSIAVVPCDCNKTAIFPTSMDSLYITELSSGNIEIVQHGLTHQDINYNGEFGGLDSIESMQRIVQGKSVLQTVIHKEITTFIPPFNAYNSYTEEAILQNGMSILSADIYNKAYHKELQYFPETLGHLMAQKGIWCAAREAIMNCYEPNAICVVMFHAYDLPDERTWHILEQLLDDCKHSPSVELYTFQSLHKSGIQSSKYRYYANQLESGLQKYCLHKGVLHSTFICILVHILNALCLALLPLIVLFFIRKRSDSQWFRISVITISYSTSISIFTIAYLHLMGPITLLACSIGLTSILLSYIFVYRIVTK
jgi:hypothetical protein